jgi:uncharacterized OsmC-like protein
MLECRVKARRVDALGCVSTTKAAEIVLDTALDALSDAFNSAELFLTAIAACAIKGIERVTLMPDFKLRGVGLHNHAIRQNSPTKIVSVDCQSIVDTDEDDRRLELLQTNVRKYGTISNSVAAAVKLEGVIRRADN